MCGGCRAGFAPFSIRHLLQFDLLEQLPKLQVVSAAASKEAALDKALSKMQADWQGVEFRVVDYKDTGTYVVGGTDEVQVREGMLVEGQVVFSGWCAAFQLGYTSGGGPALSACCLRVSAQLASAVVCIIAEQGL